MTGQGTFLCVHLCICDVKDSQQHLTTRSTSLQTRQVEALIWVQASEPDH